MPQRLKQNKTKPYTVLKHRNRASLHNFTKQSVKDLELDSLRMLKKIKEYISFFKKLKWGKKASRKGNEKIFSKGKNGQ